MFKELLDRNEENIVGVRFLSEGCCCQFGWERIVRKSIGGGEKVDRGLMSEKRNGFDVVRIIMEEEECPHRWCTLINCS